MKKIVLGLFLALMSVNVFACEIRAFGLSDEVRQQLKVQCEQMKLASTKAGSKVIPGVDAETVGQWAQISQEFAKAIGLAAREIGVSVNEFIRTPAGMITVAVILWVSLGKSLVLLAMLPMVWVFTGIILRRLWFSHYDTVERGFWIFQRKVQVRRFIGYKDADEGMLILSFVSLAAALLLSGILLLNL